MVALRPAILVSQKEAVRSVVLIWASGIDTPDIAYSPEDDSAIAKFHRDTSTS
jgi:hypothetical protein